MTTKLTTDKAFFREEQRFSQPWIWVVLISSITAVIVLVAVGDKKEIQPENNEELAGLIIGGVILLVSMVGLTWLFLKMKLITCIDSKGLNFRYPPMINKPRWILKAEIESYEVREFKPIKEFGGHGIKTGGKSKGKSYTVSGKTGLQLILKNGDKVLIGTKRKEAIRSAMAKMMMENTTEN
ncbi:MAG TPA: hypothetical protein P5514_01010 [Bacteroidales bacterium]|nr:hypothetical protein [Bacteroidales bacterium]HRX95494.1 hypothetical protein [Bacteroidales bacterium]